MWLQWLGILWNFIKEWLPTLRSRPSDTGVRAPGTGPDGAERKPASPAAVPQWFDLMGGVDDDASILPEGYDGSVTLPDKGWAGLTVETQGAYVKLEAKSKAAGVEFRLSEGFRPRRRQAFLYTQGRKVVDGKWVKDPYAKKGIVTNALPGKSNHQLGRAFDIALRVKKGGDPYDVERLSIVGGFAGECGLQWGVDWDNDGKRDDLPHFELKVSA